MFLRVPEGAWSLLSGLPFKQKLDDSGWVIGDTSVGFSRNANLQGAPTLQFFDGEHVFTYDVGGLDFWLDTSLEKTLFEVGSSKTLGFKVVLSVEGVAGLSSDNTFTVRCVVCEMLCECVRAWAAVKGIGGSRAAMSSAPLGMGSDSCAASPRGVGRQKRAGRTKANSSMTSRQASISVPARASLHRRWQMTGTEARSRNAASPRSMLSISPAPEIQISHVPAG